MPQPPVTERFTIRIAPSYGSIPRDTWDSLSDGTNPFVAHDFFTALEDSASVGPGTGWHPAPIITENDAGELLAALPAWLKTHSQGEYVFDHGWADAWERAGGRYYPKLQITVPFTPATGPRLLTRKPELYPLLIRAAEDVCLRMELSSAHATFIAPEQIKAFTDAGWLIREDIQFHWENRGYADFDAFLGTLSSAKRKNLRKERAAAQAGITIQTLAGKDIRDEHWDAFWRFYQDTGSRKWGQPYLTREAFTLMSQRMGAKLLLMLAYVDGACVAGALHFVGQGTLYGRYWGALIDKPYLHFELCYYQAIDVAIRLGLTKVEAGAQGGHKLARGYEPVRTVSAHWIANPDLRQAVADFLARESEGIASEQQLLFEHSPFRSDIKRASDE